MNNQSQTPEEQDSEAEGAATEQQATSQNLLGQRPPEDATHEQRIAFARAILNATGDDALQEIRYGFGNKGGDGDPPFAINRSVAKKKELTDEEGNFRYSRSGD